MAIVTQKMIAEKAGVSRSTVAAVLNDFKGVSISDEKRKRVMRAVKRLNYSPNRFAQAMRGGRTGMIGIVQKSGNRIDRWSHQLASILIAEIRKRGYDATVNDIYWYQDDGRAAWKYLLDSHPEGLVLLSPDKFTPPEALKEIRDRQLPVVSIAGYLFEEFPTFDIDMKTVSYELTSRVLRAGRKHPILVLYKAIYEDERKEFMSPRNKLRREGFVQAVEEAGLSRNSWDILELPAEFSGPRSHYRSGREVMEKLLTRKQLPDAVFFKNDRWAVGAMVACHTAGIKVPDTIAITGFQNDEFGEYTTPPLTTINLPVKQLAQASVESLFSQIKSKATGEPLVYHLDTQRFPCQIIERGSTPRVT